MAIPPLQPGVLLRLLHGTSIPFVAAADGPDPSPPLLQVTGITPALSGPGPDPDPFSPRRGFLLRLSDSSHSCIVSLPSDHSDLVLSDRLRLGNLLRILRLDPPSPSSPSAAPVLRDFRLLPGPLPFVPSAAPDSPSDIKEVIVSSSATSPMNNGRAKRRGINRGSSDVLSELRKISIACGVGDEEESSDSDESRLSFASSSFSSSRSPSTCVASAPMSTVRKSWDASGRSKERRPLLRTQSASVSPNRLAQYGSATSKNNAVNDLLVSKKEAERAFKVLGGYSNKPLYASNRMAKESSCTADPFSFTNNMKLRENSVVWASLPLTLVKLGKEALRQRDSALQAALNALLEASASEKLIQCLSVYAELQSDKDEDPRSVIERFLKFHQDLDQAISIIQSITKPRQSRACSCNSTGLASAKAAAKAAFRRKECAFSWIKATLDSDLSQFPYQMKDTSKPKESSLTSDNFLVPLTCCQKPKCSCMERKRKNSNISGEGRGSTAATDLANSLRTECNRWFLKYIEKFLDAVESKSSYAPCKSQVASLLCQLKRVDGFLNDISKKERSCFNDRRRESSLWEDEENEACERVRKKIYPVLLRHVESAAIALECMSATDEEKEQE
ncbi:uncharacterized protein LOC109708666 [Ananas comosus]|uniref:Uncharacterized protein LOC109708666 n=1 Tax=Ananas comosus TaxID=4615 RepID=A0A6P5EY48_ANACO|nr:uncharacterized protein LOC109708666 [Ananas comosus]